MKSGRTVFLTTPNYTTSLVTHFNIPASSPRKSETLIRQDVQLSLVVDEYTITPTLENVVSTAGGLTLVFTHGTSFNKALWKPTIARVLRKLDGPDCHPRRKTWVKKILAIDAINHGESWEINKKFLSDVSHWPDQSRDILQVLKHFGVRQPVIGIGHSFGGGILAHAALMAPELFAATIFIDPILFRMDAQDRLTAGRALRRRDQWDDLESVRESFRKNKGFDDWHSEVLELHIEHSTKESVREGKACRVLSTPKSQEAATYVAAPFPQLTEMLANSSQLHFFVLGGKSIVIPQKDREWIQSICKAPGQPIVMEEAGHLIPMQDPDRLAQNLGTLLTEISASRAEHVKSVL